MYIVNVGHQTRQTDGWTYLEIEREKVVADLLQSMDFFKGSQIDTLFETRRFPFPGGTNKDEKKIETRHGANHA